MRKLFSVLMLTVFMSGNLNANSFTSTDNPECFADAIEIYHSYLNRFGNRELAIDRANEFYDECAYPELYEDF